MIYVATPIPEAEVLRSLRVERGTVSQIIEQYFETTGDPRDSVSMREINDWYEERGWIWVQE